jgi:predicted dehydrogenase
VAIIGCGKIADQHVQAMARLGGCEIVGLCDREVLMAQQLGERFRVPRCFAEAGEMLREARPEVVHITTPPQSHAALGRQCLEAGAHVYLEKPFTVTTEEAQALIRLAEQRSLKVTAGHNLQFTLEMLEMRRLVREGFLGGPVVHLESHFPYGLGDTSYVGPLLGNRNHWVRQLPGQLFHNIISHGVAKLAEHLHEDLVEVRASAHQSEQLRQLGGQEILDELRVLIRDAAGATAFFCFSTQLKPGLNILRIGGPKNSLLVDHGAGTVTRQRSHADKSYLGYFLPPLRQAREQGRHGLRNIVRFLRRQLYQDYGMKELIGQFYASIREGGPPPIPYREILLTCRIMDEIFAQVYPRTADAVPSGGAVAASAPAR